MGVIKSQVGHGGDLNITVIITEIGHYMEGKECFATQSFMQQQTYTLYNGKHGHDIKLIGTAG